MSATHHSNDWWLDFFDATFADVVLARPDDGEIDRTLDRLCALLALQPGARVLDQGCGIGRLSIPLARRGFDVVAIDLVPSYVARAREAAKRAEVACELIVADAFEAIVEPCDGAFNWHTSFGYAIDDARNEAMLRAAFASLRSGGRFALDYPNMPRVLREFQPTMEQWVQTPRGALRVVRASTIDRARGLLDQRWIYHFPDGDRTERRGVTRTYSPDDLAAMFARCGFVDVSLEVDARCVVVGRRP